MTPILIVGIGNILLRDEGVGVRTIERMQGVALPPGVELLDGGTSGADLIDDIANRRKVIVIDAVQTDAPAGTIVRCTADELLDDAAGTLSLHEFGFLSTLLMARQLGCAPQEVVIYGVQPGQVALGLELTAEVAAVLPRLIAAVLDEAAQAEPAGQGQAAQTPACG